MTTCRCFATLGRIRSALRREFSPAKIGFRVALTRNPRVGLAARRCRRARRHIMQRHADVRARALIVARKALFHLAAELGLKADVNGVGFCPRHIALVQCAATTFAPALPTQVEAEAPDRVHILAVGSSGLQDRLGDDEAVGEEVERPLDQPVNTPLRSLSRSARNSSNSRRSSGGMVRRSDAPPACAARIRRSVPSILGAPFPEHHWRRDVGRRSGNHRKRSRTTILSPPVRPLHQVFRAAPRPP